MHFNTSTPLQPGISTPNSFPLPGEVQNPKRKMLESIQNRISTLMNEAPEKLFTPEGLQLQNKRLELELELTKVELEQFRSAAPNEELQKKYTVELNKTAMLSAQFDESQKKLAEAENTKSELLSSKRKLELDLQHETQTAKRQKEESDKQEAALRKRIETIQQSSLRPSNGSNSSSNSDNESTREMTKRLKKEVQDKSAEISGYKTSLERLEKEKNACVNQIKNFNELLDTLQALIAQNEVKIQELATINSQYKASSNEAEKKLADTLVSLQTLETDFEKQTHQKSAAQKKVKELEAQAQTLKTQMGKIEQNAATLKADNEKLTIEFNEAKTQLDKQKELVQVFGDLSKKYANLVTDSKK